MELIISNWKKILSITILMIGIIMGVYLVQTRQIFKGRAYTDVNEAFEVTDDLGNSLEDKCTGDRCEVNSLKINIKIKDIPALLER